MKSIKNKPVLRQPQALKFLIMVEMWERFAYFSMISLLVLFMHSQFSMPDKNAYLIFGAFGSLLFIAPIIGGFLADKILGQLHAIILGIILLVFGYFVLSTCSRTFFSFALSLLILGNGFFKPNISSLLGLCYETEDSRREAGFKWFYIGINVGATAGVIICGIIANSVGWAAAFCLAGSVLLIGLIFLLIGLKTIKADIKNPIKSANIPTIIKICLAAIVVNIPIIWLMSHPNFADIFLMLFSVFLLAILSIIAFRLETVARNKFIVCIVLIIFSIAFWTLYQQGPMSLTLFIMRDVNRHVFGFTIPTSVVGTLNGFFLIGLIPLTVKTEQLLERCHIRLSIPTKFALGIFLMGFGYLVISLSAAIPLHTHKTISLAWVVLSFGLQTLGEIFLSPVGLAMITVLAPEKFRSMTMGIWFFSLAAATAIASQLAKIANIANNKMGLIDSASIYHHAFADYTWLALATGLLLLLLIPRLKKLLV